MIDDHSTTCTETQAFRGSRPVDQAYRQIPRLALGMNRLLLATALVLSGCGSDSESAEEPARSSRPANAGPLAPAELVGTYARGAVTLTISPTGLSSQPEHAWQNTASVNWTWIAEVAPGTWQFGCEPAVHISYFEVTGGSISRSADGSIVVGINASDGAADEVGRMSGSFSSSAPGAGVRRVATIPEWMHGGWGKVVDHEGCECWELVTVRASSVTRRHDRRSGGSTVAGEPCVAGADERTFPAVEGEVEGDSRYRAGGFTFQRNGGSLLVSPSDGPAETPWAAFEPGTWSGI